MRLVHLPKVAIVTIIIATVAGLSGVAYAAYQLWLSPTTTIQSVSQSGDKTNITLSLQNCNQPKLNVQEKQGANLTPTQVADYIEAYCQTQAIQNWAINTLHLQPSDVLLPYDITSSNNNSLSAEDVGSPSYKVQVVSSTMYLNDSSLVTRAAIRVGDEVALVVNNDNPTTTRAVIVLNLPAGYYNPMVFGEDFFEVVPCGGNTSANCIDTPSVGVWGSLEGTPNNSNENDFEIQGQLVSSAATSLVIRATSGKLYTITTPTNVIEAFNTKQTYGPMTIGLGDVLDVTYQQPGGANPKDITSNQLQAISLLMNDVPKATSFTNSDKYHYNQ